MLLVSLSLVAFSVEPAPRQEVDFLKEVWPILESRCIECHGPDEQEGDLRLDDVRWESCESG